MLKTKWLEALRSGRYRQGKWALRNSDETYCCLGVLCDIVDSNKWNKEEYDYDWDDDGQKYSTLLPLSIHELFQVIPIDNLIQKNDSGSTFEEIALYIEANVQEKTDEQ